MIHRFDKFGGMIPRLGNDALPEGAASHAADVDLGHGTLRHQGATSIASRATFPSGEIVGIPKPKRLTTAATPGAGEMNIAVDYVFKPNVAGRLKIAAYMYVQDFTTGGNGEGYYLYGTADYNATTPTAPSNPPSASDNAKNPSWNMERTETGMVINYYCPSVAGVPSGGVHSHNPFNMYAGGTFKVTGPRYQVWMAADPTGAWGGPATAVFAPHIPSLGDPEIPQAQIPLINSAGVVYGHFQVVDVEGPDFTEDYAPVENSTYLFPAFSSRLIVNMNYTRPRRNYFHYVTTWKDTSDREGPPSELSDKIIVKPGQHAQFTVPNDSGETSPRMQVYRNTTGQVDDFVLIKEHLAPGALFEDYDLNPIGGPIPLYGNFPNKTATFTDKKSNSGVLANYTSIVSREAITKTLVNNATAKAALLGAVNSETAVMHPAHFAAAFLDKELWFSDQYRLHAWPKEFVIGFPETILALAVTGNTVLVFTATTVYGCSGSNPENMSRGIVSNIHGLYVPSGVSARSLVCSQGDKVFWLAKDGIAMTQGGPAELVTEPFYQALDWSAISSTVTGIYVEDGSVWVARSSGYEGTQLRLMLSPVPALSYTSNIPVGSGNTANGTGAWFSWIKTLPTPVNLSHLRLFYTGNTPEQVKVVNMETGESYTLGASVPASGTLVEMSLSYVRKFRVEAVISAGKTTDISAIEVMSPDSILVTDGANLDWMDDGQGEPPWVAGRYALPTPGAPACARILAEEYPVTLKIYSSDGTSESLALNWSVSDSNPFMLPRFAAAPVWRFSLSAPTGKRVLGFSWRPWMEQDAPGDVLRLTKQNQLFAPWMYTRWQVPATASVGSFRVFCVGGDFLRLFKDACSSFNYEEITTSGCELVPGTAVSGFSVLYFQVYKDGEYVPSNGTAETAAELDMTRWSADTDVDELFIYFAQDVPVDGPVIMRGVPPGQGWRNKTLVFPSSGVWSTGRVVSTSYPVSMTLCVPGYSSPTVFTINDDADFCFETNGGAWLGESKRWALDINANGGEVSEVALFPRVVTPCGNSVIIRRESTPWTWRDLRVQTAHPLDFSCARVVSSLYGDITLTIRCTDTTGNSQAFQIANGNAFRLPRLGPGRMWRFDVTGANAENVTEIAISTSMRGLANGA